MARPLNDSPYLYGLHDPGGEGLMAQAGAAGWILFTEELGSDPNNRTGVDYSKWANAGYGIMARLNNGYEPNGTIPKASKYRDFSRRVANFVAASRGCHIWIIGNEMNFTVERPGGETITPKMYASCYTLCRNAVRSVAGHAGDQVITGAVAPWNVQTTYDGNPTGDWVQYHTDLLRALGPGGCDGIAIHAYTHGADPNLIHSNDPMSPPFGHRQYNFRVYQDFMRGIPLDMRHLPVYLTEADQNDAWQNVNRGWIQRAYGEIDWWNRQPDTQVIRALILYRWPNVDRWGLEGKAALHEDFRQAMAHKYNWEAAMTSKPVITPPAEAGSVAQPSFTDITNQLSRDPAGFARRTRADIKYLVINHTGVRPEIGADRVANAQRQRWPGILSQFYITGDGKIQRTEPDLEAVSKDQAWIFNGLNVYVAGNFDAAVPSDAQLAALAHLCAWLMDQYDLKAEALKGVSEFIQTHSPGLQWLTGACWKDALLKLTAAVPGAPIAPDNGQVQALQAEIARLKAQVQALTDQVNQLIADKAGLTKQVQTLQAESAALLLQVKNLNDANTTLKAQLKTSETEKQALQKRVAELEARIAELTKGTETVAAPPIRDVTDSLPKHATDRYETRPLSKITTLAIHHSAAAGDIPPQNVAAYHVRRDWPGMGYHFYIMGDGTIYQCNNLESISYHAGYANTYSVGICLAGRFMDGALPPDKQMAAATHLVAYLAQKLHIPQANIKGHKELPQTSTACPGAEWVEGKRWKDNFLAQVKARLG